jgi:hypothetical protein
MRYGIVLWGGSNEGRKILRTQKKMIRMMVSMSMGESCRQKFKELSIPTVTSLYVLETCFMKKYKGGTPANSVIHDYNTRGKSDLHVRSCRTSIFQTSVVNMGTKLFNHLPVELKQLVDFKQFRKK